MPTPPESPSTRHLLRLPSLSEHTSYPAQHQIQQEQIAGGNICKITVDKGQTGGHLGLQSSLASINMIFRLKHFGYHHFESPQSHRNGEKALKICLRWWKK